MNVESELLWLKQHQLNEIVTRKKQEEEKEEEEEAQEKNIEGTMKNVAKYQIID
jgi:hypothetical protein